MPRHFLLASVSVLLLSAVIFGGAQMIEVNKLRASIAEMEKERSNLRKLIQASQPHYAAEVVAQPNAESSGSVDPDPGSVNTTTPENPLVRPRSRPDGGGGGFANLLNSPEVQQLMAIQQKAGLDGRYAALFKKLNLSPAELENFKSLLVDKQSTLMDVMAAARTQGLTGRESRDDIRQLVTDTQAEIDGNIRATLGESAYAEYKNFETTLPQRSVVSQLEQRLSYSTSPLNDSQTEQLVQILAANAPTPTAGSGGNRGGSAGQMIQAFTAGNPRMAQASTLIAAASTPITDTVIAQAKGVLTPTQVSALQGLQQEQQATTQLMQQMRNQGRTGQSRTQPGSRQN